MPLTLTYLQTVGAGALLLKDLSSKSDKLKTCESEFVQNWKTTNLFHQSPSHYLLTHPTLHQKPHHSPVHLDQ